MSEGRPGSWRRAAAVMAVLTLLAWPAPGLAHLDPPGPPGLDGSVNANRLDLTADQDDGLDGNAELLLAVNVTHEDHGQSTAEFEKDDYDWDAGVGWLLTPALIWTHRECTPRAPITVGTALVELDSTRSDQAWGALASAAAGAAVGSYGGLPGAIAGGLVGLGISLVTALNGNDVLGVGSALIPANGARTINSVGADGGADIALSGTTSPVAEPGCAAAPPPQPHLTPGERAERTFPQIRQALALAGKVEAEPGNPAGLTAQQVLEIRTTLSRAAVGMAELLAAAELDGARGYAGFSTALELFAGGRKLPAGSPAEAVQLYQGAFLAAASARAAGVQQDEAQLPLTLALAGDYFSTRSGRRLQALALLLGAGSQSALTAKGPAGMEVGVTRVGTEGHLYRIDLGVGHVEPGTYTVNLEAGADGKTASRTLTVLVNPDPPTRLNGVDVAAESDGRQTIARIDPARDQAFSDQAGSFRVKIPAGAIAGPDGAAGVIEMSEAELADLLTEVQPPAELSPLGRAFQVMAETSEGPVERFDQPVTFTVRAPADLPPTAGLFHLHENGSLAFAGGRLLNGALVARLSEPGLYVLADVQPGLEDLVGHWARADGLLMASKYIVRGVAPGRFDPAGRVTRAQFAALMVRATGLTAGAPAAAFTDVRPSDWFYAEVMTAAGLGLIKGMGDGTFAPNAPVTREQVAVMLARALVRTGKALPLSAAEVESTLAGFPDRAEVSAWARADLALAIRAGLVQGLDGGRLAPAAQASRAEAAVMTARFWR